MKKTALAAALILLLSLTLLSVSAGSDDAQFKSLVLEKFRYYSPSETFNASASQRGYGASHDGKYLFGGFLGGEEAVVKFDAKTGDPISAYKTPDHPKGITTDDRGNLFVGICNAAQADSFNIATLDPETMKERAIITQPVGSGKVGVNGIAVYNEYGTYYMYVVVNYDYQRLYRFDCTDPVNIELDTSYGNGGYVDLEDLTKVKGCEGQYIDMDYMGNLYISIFLDKGSSKGDALFKIDYDGELVGSVDCKECYGVSVNGEYVATSTYNGADSCVYIFDCETLKQVAQIKTKTNDHSHFTGVTLFNDRIVVAEQGYNGQTGFWTVDGISLPEEPVLTIEATDDASASSVSPSTAEPISFAMLITAVITGAAMTVTRKRR